MQIAEESVLAPAKVNLCLRVLGRRADGYHLLDSIFVSVSLYDQLHLRLTPSRTSSPQNRVILSVESGDAPGDATNLAFQAADRLLTAVERQCTVQIRLAKRIPSGSGLGGGSSDAAAVLLSLNRLLGSPLSTAGLCRLAEQIGADVPFFLYGRPARVGGVGEQITPITLPTDLQLVLCWPGYSLSTASIYSRFDMASLTSEAPATNIADFVSGRRPLSDMLVNDLEAAVAQVRPEVLSLKARLVKEGALGALMSGSGSAVFGVWSDPQAACNAALRLRQQGLWAEAVHTLRVSPAVAN